MPAALRRVSRPEGVPTDRFIAATRAEVKGRRPSAHPIRVCALPPRTSNGNCHADCKESAPMSQGVEREGLCAHARALVESGGQRRNANGLARASRLAPPTLVVADPADLRTRPAPACVLRWARCRTDTRRSANTVSL